MNEDILLVYKKLSFLIYLYYMKQNIIFRYVLIILLIDIWGTHDGDAVSRL